MEFRVYVEAGRPVGISNYYPQVALDFPDIRPAMATALDLARKITHTLERLHLGVGNHALCPDARPGDPRTPGPDWMPESWGRQDYTLDFMLLDTGLVVFLEGGPAGFDYAHPCCFLQEGRDLDTAYLHGVATSVIDPIRPLHDLEQAE